MAVSGAKFAGSSILLFLDLLLVSASNWLYWLVLSKVATTSEVGQTTAIYNLVVLISSISVLGFEYPLLKRAAVDRDRILGLMVVMEFLITFACIPVILYVGGSSYQESLHSFLWMAAVMLVLYSVRYLLRFGLLGISDARSVLIINIIGTAIRFVTGYILVSYGSGAFGILMSFLSQEIFITAVTAFVASRSFRFRLVTDMQYIKEILRDGLANTPSKLSRTLIFSLSVVLLASFGISDSQVGIFYMSLMLSIIAGGLASNMASMAIPASSSTGTDLSASSLRIGLTYTSPLIASLVVAPKLVLSLIGAAYTSGASILLILAIGIFPFTIVTNTITKLNNRAQSKRLLLLGLIQISSFLVGFFILVPSYGTVGAGFAVLFAFTSSVVPSLKWSERASLKYIAYCGVSIMVGVAIGYAVAMVLNSVIAIVTSIGVTYALLVKFKNTSPKEVEQLVKAVIMRRA